MLHYIIEYKDSDLPWEHKLVTTDYTLFFDEASKLLDKKAADLAPAFITALPGFEDERINYLAVKDIEIRSADWSF